MMKVLMIGPARSVHGGISAVVNNLYEAGLSDRVELEYIGTMKEGSKLRKLVIAAWAYIRFLMNLESADVVHVNVASDNSFRRKALFIKAAHRKGKKIVIHQHGGNFDYFVNHEISAKERENIIDVLKMADVVIVLSEGWRKFFAELLNDETRIEVLNNAIILPKKSTLEDKRYGQHQLLYLGRICRDKGINELIEAVNALKQEYPEMHLYLGGIFEESEYVEKIKAHEDVMTYIGWVTGDEKAEYLQECDILVLPSYYEGFPVCVVDGMAYGCAVVATHVGAIPEIIEDRVNGILIEPKNPENLIEGLRSLLKDENFLLRIGQNARIKASVQYDIRKIIDRLVEIYEGLYE